MTRYKVSVIIGTRPEVIKLSPVVLELLKMPLIDVSVCVTGQHKDMVYGFLDYFSIAANVELKIERNSSGLSEYTAKAIESISAYIYSFNPDLIILQGDTSTVLSASISSMYNKKPIAHVEAGLRTGDKYSPFPEEMNRVVTSHLSDLHFAPTDVAKKNLIDEGISSKNIFVTGNTVIDALFIALEQNKKALPEIDGLPDFLQPRIFYQELNKVQIVLVTGHRRENFGAGLMSICEALNYLASEYPMTHFVYPVHLNPEVLASVNEYFSLNSSFESSSKRSNIHLINPLDYSQFVELMNMSYFIMTDSGGVQEEAPSLNKPVLVMRDNTERPEAVESGCAMLVGTDKNVIINNAVRLFEERHFYDQMSFTENPYGNGCASTEIGKKCLQFLETRYINKS